MFQVFPRENVLSALVTVYKYNVLQFQGGTMGAVNGMRPNGQVSSLVTNTVTVVKAAQPLVLYLYCYFDKHYRSNTPRFNECSNCNCVLLVLYTLC